MHLSQFLFSLSSLSASLALLLYFLYGTLISDSTSHPKRCHTKPCVELQYCPKRKKHQPLNANLLISLWATESTPLRLPLTSLLHPMYEEQFFPGLGMVCNGANSTQGSGSSLEKTGPYPHVMRYVSVCNDTTAKLYTFKILLDRRHVTRSEWLPDKQHRVFQAGCVHWQLGAVASLDVASDICSKQNQSDRFKR